MDSIDQRSGFTFCGAWSWSTLSTKATVVVKGVMRVNIFSDFEQFYLTFVKSYTFPDCLLHIFTKVKKSNQRYKLEIEWVKKNKHDHKRIIFYFILVHVFMYISEQWNNAYLIDNKIQILIKCILPTCNMLNRKVLHKINKRTVHQIQVLISASI